MDDATDREQPIYLVECTCEHDEHNWIKCQVPGCDCEGHLEE